MRPNVALIVLDTARADAFEPYGAAPGRSPAFADLARRGVALDAMHAASCWTLPSHVSLLSGLLPRAAGIAPPLVSGRDPSAFKPVIEGLRDRLLPEVLRRAGYETAAVSANPWITEQLGFGTGFQRFVSLRGERQTSMNESSFRGRARWMAAGLRAGADDGAAAAEGAVRSMLEGTGRPFFLFVNLMECHSPYLPPKPYNELGPVERARAAAEAQRYLTTWAFWKAAAGRFDVPPSALERIRRLYAGAIRQVDDWLERFLDTLERLGALEDTLLIVTSDHGENLGEGGLMAHTCSLDDRLIRVPCAVAGPGAFAPRGTESLAALPRLIAEAIELDEHPWREGIPGDGVAVAQFDSSFRPDDPTMRAVLTQWGLGAEAMARITTPITCATDGRYKLVLRGREEMLYDLAADPLEAAPLPVGQTGNGDLAALREALSDPAALAGDAERAPATPEVAAEVPEEERRELEERMRMLGYL